MLGYFQTRISFVRLLVLFIIIISLIAGLIWLAILVFGFYGLCFILFSIKPVRKHKPLALTIALLMSICSGKLISIFIFEIRHVPSESMESVLYPGDNIFVSKLNYGPEISNILTSLLNISFIHKFSTAIFSLTKEGDYRLKGFTKISRGDILVFKKNTLENNLLVKRCIAMPKDTLSITDGEIFINGKYCPQKASVKYAYQVQIVKKELFLLYSKNLGFEYFAQGKNQNFKIANILVTKADVDILKLKKIILNEVRLNDNESCFPYNERFKWTPDNFGPFIIPGKGISIELNKENYILYRNILKNSEHLNIINVNTMFFLAGKPIKKITFKKNYFFMMGDNRPKSNDSRFWGCVAEKKH